METLTEQDIVVLTTIQNKFIRMRKREAANANRLGYDITQIINEIQSLKQMLQCRFEIPMDPDIDN